MGSLSEGIKREAFAKGESEIIRKLYQKGFPVEQIASITDKSEDEVRAMIEGKELEFV